ncbi:hypothetical protein NL676_029259 [Syzygium grande]|nr:hypothetical protein NL676_029259 [Syzygium grande]
MITHHSRHSIYLCRIRPLFPVDVHHEKFLLTLQPLHTNSSWQVRNSIISPRVMWFPRLIPPYGFSTRQGIKNYSKIFLPVGSAAGRGRQDDAGVVKVVHILSLSSGWSHLVRSCYKGPGGKVCENSWTTSSRRSSMAIGSESRHPGVPYTVFPGNVGSSTALAELVKLWAPAVRLSPRKELLRFWIIKIGVFNRIKLVHPAAFKQGGIPLVACCISAAEQANVPVTAHFDRGTSKEDLSGAINLAWTEDDLTAEYMRRKNLLIALVQMPWRLRLGNVNGKYPPGGPNLRLDFLRVWNILLWALIKNLDHATVTV